LGQLPQLKLSAHSLLNIQLDPAKPAKPAKFHLKLLKNILTADELAIGLVEKTSSEKPLLDGVKFNLLKGNFYHFKFKYLIFIFY
jgi:hypothetical protein